MDRNRTVQIEVIVVDVALRKESVDRNSTGPANLMESTVALRKESVDRNIWVDKTQCAASMSLSARRAWIEMANFCKNRFCPTVALRKESVDRNIISPHSTPDNGSRSPQGERG